MKSLSLAALLTLGLSSIGHAAANKADEGAVRQAVLDYVDRASERDRLQIASLVGSHSTHPRDGTPVLLA